MGNEDADHGVEVLDRAEGAAVDGLPLRIGTVQAGLSSSLSTINAQLPDSPTFRRVSIAVSTSSMSATTGGALALVRPPRSAPRPSWTSFASTVSTVNHLIQDGQAPPEWGQRRCRQCRRSVSPSNDAGHPPTVLATVGGPGQDGLDGSAPHLVAGDSLPGCRSSNTDADAEMSAGGTCGERGPR
jgi:hypothetical protein